MDLRFTKNSKFAKPSMVEMMESSSNPLGGKSVSLRNLIACFRWQIVCTWFLVILEAAMMLTFPLLLGIAIDGMHRQSFLGLSLLGGVGVLTVVVGSARRFYDTRVYSRIYIAAGKQIVEQERKRNANVSVISARTNMVRELVEFLESSLPGIVDCVIGLLGTLVMICFLQVKVFAGCLIGGLTPFFVHFE